MSIALLGVVHHVLPHIGLSIVCCSTSGSFFTFDSLFFLGVGGIGPFTVYSNVTTTRYNFLKKKIG
jgi:hypothetical protein